EALVRAGRRARPVRELDRARDAGAEADGVVRAIDVVVHRLRNGDDVHALIVQALAIAQGVIAADRNEHVDAEVREVLEHILRHVVDLRVIAGHECRHALAREMAGARSRRVKKRTAGPRRRIHDGLVELLHALAVVGSLVAIVIDEARPPTADANDTISLAQGTDGNRADRGTSAGARAAAGANGSRSLPVPPR